MRSKIEARWAIPMIALGVLLALILDYGDSGNARA